MHIARTQLRNHAREYHVGLIARRELRQPEGCQANIDDVCQKVRRYPLVASEDIRPATLSSTRAPLIRCSFPSPSVLDKVLIKSLFAAPLVLLDAGVFGPKLVFVACPHSLLQQVLALLLARQASGEVVGWASNHFADLREFRRLGL